MIEWSEEELAEQEILVVAKEIFNKLLWNEKVFRFGIEKENDEDENGKNAFKLTEIGDKKARELFLKLFPSTSIFENDCGLEF